MQVFPDPPSAIDLRSGQRTRVKDKKRGSEEIKEGRENSTGRERRVITTQTAEGRKVTRRVAGKLGRTFRRARADRLDLPFRFGILDVECGWETGWVRA